jgi:hypothetical protein
MLLLRTLKGRPSQREAGKSVCPHSIPSMVYPSESNQASGLNRPTNLIAYIEALAGILLQKYFKTFFALFKLPVGTLRM